MNPIINEKTDYFGLLPAWSDLYNKIQLKVIERAVSQIINKYGMGIISKRYLGS